MEAIEHRKPNRLPESALLAVALHAALLLAFGLLADLAPPKAPEPISVTLETIVPLVEAPQRVAVEAPRASAPAPAPQPEVPTGAAPAAVAPPAAAVPTPRSTSREALRDALRGLAPQASSTAPATASAPELPRATSPSASNLPPPVPFAPNADAGRPAPGASQATRSAPAPTQKAELDYRALDERLARAPTGGGAQAPSGAGGAPATAPAGTTSGSGAAIEWEVPGTERKLLAGRDPVISASPEMLPIDAVVAFTLEPSGLVSSVKVTKSSGFAEVDAAFVAAVRRYSFEPAPGAAIVKGRRRFVLTSLAR